MERTRASSYSRRRRSKRTRKNEMEHKRALMRNLLYNPFGAKKVIWGIKVPA
jgi:hypothetical protein